MVGVFTEIKIISALSIAASTSVVKNKFLPLASLTTSAKPGSYIGRLSKFLSFQAAIRFSLISTTVTVICGHFCAITDIVGPPT